MSGGGVTVISPEISHIGSAGPHNEDQATRSDLEDQQLLAVSNGLGLSSLGLVTTI